MLKQSIHNNQKLSTKQSSFTADLQCKHPHTSIGTLASKREFPDASFHTQASTTITFVTNTKKNYLLDAQTDEAAIGVTKTQADYFYCDTDTDGLLVGHTDRRSNYRSS